jgi:hypothetical protein
MIHIIGLDWILRKKHEISQKFDVTIDKIS